MLKFIKSNLKTVLITTSTLIISVTGVVGYSMVNKPLNVKTNDTVSVIDYNLDKATQSSIDKDQNDKIASLASSISESSVAPVETKIVYVPTPTPASTAPVAVSSSSVVAKKDVVTFKPNLVDTISGCATLKIYNSVYRKNKSCWVRVGEYGRFLYIHKFINDLPISYEIYAVPNVASLFATITEEVIKTFVLMTEQQVLDYIEANL